MSKNKTRRHAETHPGCASSHNSFSVECRHLGALKFLKEMGRRRKTAKFGVTKKSKEKIPTTFNCPFCASTETVRCVLDKDRQIGFVQCDVCRESFSTNITPLSEAVDVYCDWIDACEEAN